MRKTVSVVVADVTVVGERRDPEATRRPIARSLERVVRVVERHGGTVDMRLPGAVTAVFGIPAVHEDDVLRALRASIELRDDVAALGEELEREWQVRVGIRAAVNTGEVVVGGDAAAGHELVACFGVTGRASSRRGSRARRPARCPG